MDYSSKPVTVLLAEPEDLVREALAALCEKTARHQVIGQCADGLAALRFIETTNPQIVVTSLDLTGLHTLDLISKVRDCGGAVRFVVVTTRRDRKTVLETLRAGASAYLLRSGPARELFEALDQVVVGGIYLSALVEAEKVFTVPSTNVTADPLRLLSSREYQVFTLLVEGIRAKEIASRLDVSPKTIDSHRKGLMRKLDIHDVAGLVKFAIRNNLT